MQQVRPWHIVLFVAAAGALAFLGYQILRGDGIDVAHELLVADIATGEIYEIDTNGRGIALPARHPDTGERTLYPIFRGEGGEWMLESRALAAISERNIETGTVIDKETGAITVDANRIRHINAKRLVKR